MARLANEVHIAWKLLGRDSPAARDLAETARSSPLQVQAFGLPLTLERCVPLAYSALSVAGLYMMQKLHIHL